MLMHANAHRGCTDTVRESALEQNDSGRKIPCPVRELNPRQYCAWLFSWTLSQLSYPARLHCVCVCVCVCVPHVFLAVRFVRYHKTCLCSVCVCACVHACVCVCVCVRVLKPALFCVFLLVPIQQNIPDNKHNKPHHKLPPPPEKTKNIKNTHPTTTNKYNNNKQTNKQN